MQSIHVTPPDREVQHVPPEAEAGQDDAGGQDDGHHDGNHSQSPVILTWQRQTRLCSVVETKETSPLSLSLFRFSSVALSDVQGRRLRAFLHLLLYFPSLGNKVIFISDTLTRKPQLLHGLVFCSFVLREVFEDCEAHEFE